MAYRVRSRAVGNIGGKIIDLEGEIFRLGTERPESMTFSTSFGIRRLVFKAGELLYLALKR